MFGPTDDGEDRSPLYERYSIELQGAKDAPELSDGGAIGLKLDTTRGDVSCLLHAPESNAGTAVLFVPGGRGGFAGPANGLYAELADELTKRSIAALRLDYRHPADLDESTLDALAAVWHLASLGYQRCVAVGHSFGGAVAIGASRYSTHIRAVAAMSSQSHGAGDVMLLAPRPFLLIHGERDGTIPIAKAELIFSWAFEPKRFVTFPNADHGLRESRDEVRDLLLDWLPEVVAG